MPRVTSLRVGLGLVAAFYVLSFPYHPALRSPNELCRLWTARALVDHGTVVLNQTMREFGGVGDLSCTREVLGPEGSALIPCVGPGSQPHGQVVAQRYYASKAPLLSFLGAPVYWALKQAGGPVSELSQVLWSRWLWTVLPTLGMLALLWRFLRASLDEGLAGALVVTYALGTLALHYSLSYMSHQVTAVLLFAAFFAAWKVERGEWPAWGYALAGAAAGAAVLAEYTAALGVLGVAAYAVAARWRRWGALAQAAGLVAAGAAPFLGALMAYHQAAFGHPLVSGYKFLADAGYQGWHQGGFLGIRLPDARAFFLSVFSPLRGLFALSPALALALFGLGALRREDKALWAMTLATLLGNAYFTASFEYDSWGWTPGPRHLTPLVPFLVLPMGLAVRAAGPGWRSAAAKGLLVSSVVASGLVSFVNYVPPELSTSLWALAVPMLGDGYFPVSVLAAVVPNPVSGAVLLLLLAAAVAWLATWLVRHAEGAKRAAALGLAAGAALHLLGLGAVGLLVRNVEADRAARGVVEGAWVAPAGQRLRF